MIKNIDKALIDKTSLDITGSIDRIHGGLSGAPKFPHINFLFLLTCGTSESNDLVKLTLDRMSNSGIYDHLDGGFFRYSVDEYMIPRLSMTMDPSLVFMPKLICVIKKILVKYR